MKKLISGLSTAEFLAILNQNFTELAEIREVEPFIEIDTSDDFISKINEYYGSALVLAGQSGNEFKTSLEKGLINDSGGIIDPTDVSLEWHEDYLNISFTDNNSGNYQHEIYESVDEGEYELVTTLNAGVVNYHHKTWQNANIKIKIRGKNNYYYSDYTEGDVVSPLVFRITLSTLITIHIDSIVMSTAGKKLLINWGDESITEVTSTESNSYEHEYSNTGVYWVHLTGDVNFIQHIEFMDQLAYLAGTDVSKWKLPTALNFGHFYNNDFVGDITHLYKSLPVNCVSLHLASNYLTCDMEQIIFTSVYWDIHFGSRLTSSDTEGIHGDLSLLTLPDTIAHFFISGYVYGDLTDIVPWVNTGYGTIYLSLSSNHPTGLSGDLSGWTIPDKTSGLSANTGCHFTKLPRGNFRKLGTYEFMNNSCDQSEIDNILVYIDNYFSGGVIPEANCVYKFTGSNMGVPSATGLTAKSSIEGKYVAAGFTATINVNS